MARDTSPIVKQSRREGYALHPKAHKIMVRKSGIPGEHAHGRQGKPSLYLTQLREKQKARYAYGVLEKQFRRYYAEANRMPGKTGENLVILLEARLDNVVYRAGLARTRRQARQLVSHGHFLVNGKKVNVPSYRVSQYDIIDVRDKSRTMLWFEEATENLVDADKVIPAWLQVVPSTLRILVHQLPERAQIDVPLQEQLIVELYSK